MRPAIMAVVLVLVAGCTHLQLKRNTLGQLQTVSELYQKQVLDNLAMFIYDSGSMPYFSVLSTGVNSLSDAGTASGGVTLARETLLNLFMVGQQATTVGVTRMALENWSANPVSDPRRLELMRCAYQKVVAAQMSRPEILSERCPNCSERFSEFYGAANPAQLKADARVTSACLGCSCSPPWLCWGRKKDVPRSCRDCLLVGHYCGTYVWVLPQGRDELAKLTLAILDFAINQPAVAAMSVSLTIDKYGKPVPQKAMDQSAIATVTATIPVDRFGDFLHALNNGVAAHTNKLEMAKTAGQPEPTPAPLVVPTYQNTQPPDFQFLNQRLQQLTPPR